MPRETIKSLKDKITTLETEKGVLGEKVKQLEVSLEQEKENAKNKKTQIEQTKDQVLNQKIGEFNKEKELLNQEIEKLNKEVREKQKQIDRRELKKFAEAYETQEIQFRESSQKWFRYVLIAFAVVIVVTLFIVHNTQDATWSKKIGYYFIDIVLITFLVFSLKQYSYYIKLSTDYGNRKTLAQSYFNIINSAEDAIIKNKFLDKMSDVITAKAEVEDESYTIPEKILESMTEVAKNLSKK